MNRQEIAKHLRDTIIRGKLKPGQRIVEADVCRDLNAGRGRVREALQKLEQEGFIEIIAHAGAVVREVSQKDICQIYDILGVLEGLSMRVATPMLSDEDMAEIECIVVKMEENADDKFALSKYNVEFHTLLTSLGSNERLTSFVENLRAQSHRMRLQTFYVKAQVNASIKDHRAILNAVKDRKPQKVENLIRRHYLEAKERLIKQMNRTL